VTFERPANFDLAAHWKTATALLQQKRTQFQATLALAADAALSISRWCRSSPAVDVQATGLPDGWTILHVFFESKEEARFLALGLGARVHVLSPTPLRELVLEELQKAVKRPVVRATGE
jgi:predicted DNA-binding transcriptional regulator YafY